jgi:fatty acid desaturase
MDIWQIVGGLVTTLVGLSLVIKTDWYMENFGRVEWFEDNLGSSGGTRLGYKLLGLLIMFVGIVIMTGSGGAFFGWLFSPLTKWSNPQV